jgi:hypothetical protein
MRKSFIFLLFFCVSKLVSAQYTEYEADSTTTRRQNTIFEKKQVTMVVRINPITFVGGSFTGELERVINKRFSFQIAVGYRHINLFPLYANPEQYIVPQFNHYQSGITVVPELKYYWTHFSKKMYNPAGSYLAPYVRVGQYNMKFEDNTYNGQYNVTYDLTAISGGFVFGFQILAGNKFAIDAFIGPQVKYKKPANVRWANPSASNAGAIVIDTKSQMTFEPRVGFTMGLAF